MNPFMLTFTSPSLPCWHTPYMPPDGTIAIVPRWPSATTYDVLAHPDSWALLGAVHLADAYRPTTEPHHADE